MTNKYPANPHKINRAVVPYFLTLLLGAIWNPPASAESASGEDPAVLSSRISAVTVYADRARVTRVAPVQVPAGESRYAFRKLPGWIDEGSVRVSLDPPTAGELLDVQVEKAYLAKVENDEIRQAEAAVLAVSDQIGALEDETASLEAQFRQTDAIRAFSLDKLPKDSSVREVKVEEYGAVVKFVGSTMLDIAKAKRELEKKRRELQPELSARQQKLADLRNRAQLEQRAVIVTINVPQSTQASLSLNYLLPGTTWEPVHELRGSQDGQTVSVSSFALVTQTTGEDWEGATLTFSTQRPGATARIPELEALLVGSSRALARVLSPEGDTFKAAVSNFEVQNSFYNLANNRGEVQREWADNVQAQKARQAVATVAFQKVQERGTTAQFPALSKLTVRTDGRLVRIPIGTARLSATPRVLVEGKLRFPALLAECAEPRSREFLETMSVSVDTPVGRWVGGKICDRVEDRVGVFTQITSVAFSQLTKMDNKVLPIVPFTGVRLERLGWSKQKHTAYQWLEVDAWHRTLAQPFEKLCETGSELRQPLVRNFEFDPFTNVPPHVSETETD